MTLKELAEQHVLNLDTQLAQMRQAAAQHAHEAARLGNEAEQLQKHRDEWAKVLTEVKSDG